VERKKELAKNRNEATKTASSGKTVAIALIPIAGLAVMIVFLLGPGQSLLNTGIPLPEVTIERIEFQEDKVVAYVRNTGPEEIEIVQADINDRIIPAAIEPSKTLPRLAEAKVIVPFDWNAGVPYEVGVTISDGTRFSKGVDAAALAPNPNLEQASFFVADRYVCWHNTYTDRSSVVSFYQKTECKQIQFLSEPYCRTAGIPGIGRSD
jgi:hypothetical protein